jgi:hypothetical protein
VFRPGVPLPENPREWLPRTLYHLDRLDGFWTASMEREVKRETVDGEVRVTVLNESWAWAKRGDARTFKRGSRAAFSRWAEVAA